MRAEYQPGTALSRQNTNGALSLTPLPVLIQEAIALIIGCIIRSVDFKLL